MSDRDVHLDIVGDDVDRVHGWGRWAPGGPQYPYIHSIAKRMGTVCWECKANAAGPCVEQRLGEPR